MNSDEKYMEIACRLAEKCNPSPNPRVGCVIVDSNVKSNNLSNNMIGEAQIISKGCHKYAGGKHAEIIAIEKAIENCKIKNAKNTNLKNAVMYTTLEPCNHYGRTPPCVPKIIKSGIKKVVIGSKDPLCRDSVSEFRKHNIDVVCINCKRCYEINEKWFYSVKHKLPYVLLKMACSNDFKIGRRNERVNISGDEAFKYVHDLRNEYDAILVGKNTVLADNPRLTCRKEISKRNLKINLKRNLERNPLRIVLDSALEIPLSMNIFNDNNVLIADTSLCDYAKKEELEKRGIEVCICEKESNCKKDVKNNDNDDNNNGGKGNNEKDSSEKCNGEKGSSEKVMVDIKKLLTHLFNKGVRSLLVEGGRETAISFIESRLVNEYNIIVSDKTISEAIISNAMRDKTIINEAIQNKTMNNIILNNFAIKNKAAFNNMSGQEVDIPYELRQIIPHKNAVKKNLGGEILVKYKCDI